MKELKNLRKHNEKHFLNKDGSITCYLYNNDIHYLENGVYEEIDNTLIDKGNYFINNKNAFHTLFTKNKENKILVDIKKDNYYLKMSLNNNKSKKFKLDKHEKYISFQNVLEDIDFKYELLSTKLKESIILKNKNNVPKSLEFIIDTNLDLSLDHNKINAKDQDNIIFIIDTPYMWDSTNNYNYNINYDLVKKDKYFLKLNLDQDWLDQAKFPVVIDPTIIDNTGGVNDTYIDSGNVNSNYNNNDALKVGVDSNKKIFRSFIKFLLPTIGTGSDIIDARCYLVSHSSFTSLASEKITVHNVTSSWSEGSATWSNMNNKYEARIEDYLVPRHTTISSDSNGNLTYNLERSEVNLTNLVKKWYAGLPNNGVMLKLHNETNSKVYTFYSKNNTITNISNPKPFLVITYRNQNGLEDYMSYETQEFIDGNTYINNLTGNLTGVFDLNNTIGGKYPIALSMIYNTNDVVLNKDLGYGLGLKLNLHETIVPVKIDNKDYLEYIDSDGTSHYFTYDKDDTGKEIKTQFVDEDGLGLSATLDNNKYIVSDKDSNKYIFTKNDKLYYLTELRDTSNKSVNISYDSNKRINKIEDGSNSVINLEYNSNNIIITSESKTTKVEFTNNLMTSIDSKNGITTFSYNTNNLINKIIDTNNLGYTYEYYNTSPYKIKKVIELGLNDKIGSTLTYQYEYLVTRVKDNKNRYTTYTFNTSGNTIGVTNIGSGNNLSNAYGKGLVYEGKEVLIENTDKTKVNKSANALKMNIEPIKYTKNLFKNSSFEEPDDSYTITDLYARSGKNSLEINERQLFEIGLEENKRNIGLIVYYIGVFAIPLFFMVNGYLQLRKDEIKYSYCIKKIAKIIAIVLVWNIIIAIPYFVLKGESKNIILESIKNLFLQKGYYNHFWFLGTLIIIYLLLPVLVKLFNSAEIKKPIARQHSHSNINNCMRQHRFIKYKK